MDEAKRVTVHEFRPLTRESDRKQRGQVACFLCGEFLDVKDSKRGKPYFICDGCGLQAFVRREAGIKKLDTLLNTQGHSPEIIGQVETLSKLRAKLAEIRDRRGLLDSIFGNKDLDAAETALISEITELRDELNKFPELRKQRKRKKATKSKAN